MWKVSDTGLATIPRVTWHEGKKAFSLRRSRLTERRGRNYGFGFARIIRKALCYIPNRKRFPFFHRVMVTRVKFGRTRNAVEIRAAGECFHSNFEFSQIFTSVTIILWKQRKRFLLFLWLIKARSNFLSFDRVMVNVFEPIRACVVSCLFHKYIYDISFKSLFFHSYISQIVTKKKRPKKPVKTKDSARKLTGIKMEHTITTVYVQADTSGWSVKMKIKWISI